MSSAQKRPEIPPPLEVLLTGLNDNGQRMAVVQAYYSLAEGDPNTWPVQFAVLVKAHTLAMNRFMPKPAAPQQSRPFPHRRPDVRPSTGGRQDSRSRRHAHSLSAERIKWGLLLAWGFGLLSYPLIQFLWTTLRQIAHF